MPVAPLCDPRHGYAKIERRTVLARRLLLAGHVEQGLRDFDSLIGGAKLMLAPHRLLRFLTLYAEALGRFGDAGDLELVETLRHEGERTATRVDRRQDCSPWLSRLRRVRQRSSAPAPVGSW